MSSGKAFPRLELLDFVNSINEINPYKALIADHEGHIEGKSIALGPHKIAMLLEIFKQWKEHTALMQAKDDEIKRLRAALEECMNLQDDDFVKTETKDGEIEYWINNSALHRVCGEALSGDAGRNDVGTN